MKSRLPPSVFTRVSHRKIEDDLTRRCIEKDNYIKKLEVLLRENGIDLPASDHPINPALYDIVDNLMKDGTLEEFESMLERNKNLMRNTDIAVEFYNLNYSAKVPKEKVFPTVGSVLYYLLSMWLPRDLETVHILADATGRILPRKMTLLLGPPGSGKSVLLKALSGRLRPLGGATFSGDVYFDGDNIKGNKFLVGKVADYIEQGDTHLSVLTVQETLSFAWKCTTAGHHSYARARDAAAAEVLNTDDEKQVMVQNIMMTLGIHGCKDTWVGNAMIRGVSGGQKRRVTVGEMLVCPRPVKLMDSISNGLDSATTFDIVRCIKVNSMSNGTTVVVSLLQPPPDVYSLFDEIILLTEGHIFYQGPRESVMSYFQSLGYTCPPQIDEADFLQELPTPEGKRFITTPGAPHSAQELAAAWKKSQLFQQLLSEMRYPSLKDAKLMEKSNTKLWYGDQLQQFAGSFWFYFPILVERQVKIVVRDGTYIKARILQVLIIGAISGSLFNNIALTNVVTMNGFLYFTLLFVALGTFALLPLIYTQKAVYYKQKDSHFFPTAAFCLAQSIAMFPMQVCESICYGTVVYWSAGLGVDFRGSRFLTFILINIMFSLTFSQFFRVLAACLADVRQAVPIGSIINVVMLLFSGYIQPKVLINDGWIWFYWMNPTAWALKSITINEFSSSKYDFQTCTNPSCTSTVQFGNFVLEQYGLPTDRRYIWYSFAVLVGEYCLLFLLTVLTMKYIRTEATPPAPRREPATNSDVTSDQMLLNDIGDVESGKNFRNFSETGTEMVDFIPPIMSEEASHSHHSLHGANGVVIEQLPFDPICFAFKNIWYTVTLSNGEDIDLLQNVNGYFEPGTVTALMGSSGAGKTTLMDVLAGRKNTGVVKGEMYLNGIPKVEGYFRKVIGYVEQFDTLSQKSTAREAVAFSAALRLAPNITVEAKEIWVNAVLNMMDLEPLENDLIGDMAAGGMSFEQRKRVSIAVELAANPSILFLDEPTTGLDSRASLALIKNIRKIAASGRSVVCTIHQPSTAIFNAFDQLLLLRRGGQTVYFGPLGENSQNLVEFFEMAPGVVPIRANVNPATWMLDVIGAGTSTAAIQQTDFHQYYLASTLCSVNQLHLDASITPNEGSRRLTEEDFADQTGFNASYSLQFRYLMHRIALTYWRTPSYSLLRHFAYMMIGLIFASAYPQQKYRTYLAVVSRSANVYLSAVFCGFLALLIIVPMVSAERPAFYREQQFRMYSVFVYCMTMFFIEIPYLLVSSFSFVLPYFFIVGFDNIGNVPQKFFWMWLFNFLWQGTMLFLGAFYVSLTPNQAATQVLGSLTTTVFLLFGGFLISQQYFPSFWLFMYWLDPLHYTLEGLISSQFHGDTTPIRTMNGAITTAEGYVQTVLFPAWKYESIGYDALALCLFIFAFVTGTYFCLSYLRHDSR